MHFGPQLPRGENTHWSASRRTQPSLADARHEGDGLASGAEAWTGRRTHRDEGLETGTAEEPGPADHLAGKSHCLPTQGLSATNTADFPPRPGELPRRGTRRAVPRALGNRTWLRRSEDRHAGAAGGASQQDSEGSG